MSTPATPADDAQTAAAASPPAGAVEAPDPTALVGAGRAGRGPADDHARRLHREHRAAAAPSRTSASATPTGSGSSRPTRSRSAACCCSAAGSPTTRAASGPSSSACSASPAPRRSAASPRPRSCCSRPAALQGAFAALMAPAALSIITVTFTEPKERAKAFGVFGALSGGGAAIGLIIGGVLTEYASWRWCLRRQRADRDHRRRWPPSRWCTRARRPATPATTSPACCCPRLGLVSLVYGFTEAAKREEPRRPQRHLGAGLDRTRRRSPSWCIAVVLLAAFVIWETPRDEPVAAAADRAGPQPRRRLPGVPVRRRRAVRDVPVPDVLLPDQPRATAR